MAAYFLGGKICYLFFFPTYFHILHVERTSPFTQQKASYHELTFVLYITVVKGKGQYILSSHLKQNMKSGVRDLLVFMFAMSPNFFFKYRNASQKTPTSSPSTSKNIHIRSHIHCESVGVRVWTLNLREFFTFMPKANFQLQWPSPAFPISSANQKQCDISTN